MATTKQRLVQPGTIGRVMALPGSGGNYDSAIAALQSQVSALSSAKSASGGVPSGASVTLWSLIQGIPVNIIQAAALSQPGLLERNTDGTWATVGASAANMVLTYNGTSYTFGAVTAAMTAPAVQESLTLANTALQPGSLPVATTTAAGIVKPDGTTVTVDTDGTIHSAGGGGTPTTPEPANTVSAGPASGSAALPTYRALVPADIPELPASQVTGLATVATSGAYSDITGVPPVNKGAQWVGTSALVAAAANVVYVNCPVTGTIKGARIFT